MTMATFIKLIIISCVLLAVNGMIEVEVGIVDSVSSLTTEVYVEQIKDKHRKFFHKFIDYLCEEDSVECSMGIHAMLKKQEELLDKIITHQTVCEYQAKCAKNIVIDINGNYPYCFNCLLSTQWTTKKSQLEDKVFEYFCALIKGVVENGYCRMGFKSMFNYQQDLVEKGGFADLCERMEFCPKNSFQP